MGMVSALIQLKKALAASLILHFFFIWAASYAPFFQQRIIYSAPLFVDIVRLPPPQQVKKAKEKKEEKVVYKEPKKEKAKKEVKKEQKKKEPEKLVKKVEKEVPQPSPEKIVSAFPQGKVSLDVAKFPFTYYLNIIQSRVTENWSPWLEEKEKKELTIYFCIQKQGEITHIQVEKSSGSLPLDQSALRAVALANPLPPLPQEFEEDFLSVHFGFTLEGEGS